MNLRVKSTLFLPAALIFMTACAPTLAGVVKDTDGKLISSSTATVNVTSLTTDVAVILTVNEDGSFKSDVDLPPGEYLVEALVPGYTLESKRITIGETKDLELRLKALGQEKPTAIGANLDGEVGRGAGGATLTPPKM